MGRSRVCGSWTVAGHIDRNHVARTLVQVGSTTALAYPETEMEITGLVNVGYKTCQIEERKDITKKVS